jgi:hypothetical protein
MDGNCTCTRIDAGYGKCMLVFFGCFESMNRVAERACFIRVQKNTIMSIPVFVELEGKSKGRLSAVAESGEIARSSMRNQQKLCLYELPIKQ